MSTRKPPDTPPGYRIFARPRTFDCECPACGTVVLVGTGRGRGRSAATRAAGGAYWDPLTSRLTCPSCQRTWLVGLALWPAQIMGAGAGLPADQVPGPAHLAQIRQLTGAWVQDRRKAGRSACANVSVPCTCPLWGEEAGRMAGFRKGKDAACPRHGAGGTEPDPA